ncbi:MAG: hypothetical protein IPP49_10690 [Saprospiraceae bacterium]|nr:hypothetical protein [Saprospiraceae bacterium]
MLRSGYWQQKLIIKSPAHWTPKSSAWMVQETITYYNNSPVDMTYLWLQLDENETYSGSIQTSHGPSGMFKVMNESSLDRLEALPNWKNTVSK